MTAKHSHYIKDVRHLDTIDVYRVIDLFGVTHPALQHALKKVIACGIRGQKDARQDAQEAIDSLQRFLVMRSEDEAPADKHLHLPVIDPQIKADKAVDPHAELRKIYKPGMRWQYRVPGEEWHRDDETSREPTWQPALEYRRHPDCTWKEPESEDPHAELRKMADEMPEFGGPKDFRDLLTYIGDIDSMKAESFARMYEEVATPGGQP